MNDDNPMTKILTLNEVVEQLALIVDAGTREERNQQNLEAQLAAKLMRRIKAEGIQVFPMPPLKFQQPEESNETI